jgi:hypothetical protein
MNAEERPEAKLRKGLEPIEEGSNQQLTETRTTRASLFRPVGGEIQLPVTKKISTALVPPELKVSIKSQTVIFCITYYKICMDNCPPYFYPMMLRSENGEKC